VFFAKATGHFIHALFLVVALWLALETRVGPKDFDPVALLLVQGFIWAMVAGYCAGYVLLFKQGKVQLRPSKFAANVVRLLMLAMTALLLWKNFGSIRLTNSAAAREFAKALADDLPPGNAVVLSEERQTMLLLRGELGARGRAGDVILVDTPQLISPRYHALMAANWKSRWPMALGTNASERITPDGLVKTVVSLAKKEAVFYAHPSSGLFFEKFAGESKGAVHRLTLRTNEDVSATPLTAGLLSDNERLWQARWSSHIGKRAAQFTSQRADATRWKRSSLKWLCVAERENATAAFLGDAYSKVMNHWGVQMQLGGRSGEAMEWFRRAIELNPANLAALINLEYAERRARGENAPLAMSWAREQFAAAFEHFESWYEVISRTGPVDEPTYLLQTGRLLLSTGNPRQAVAAFRRCAELCPNWPMPKLFEAQSYNKAGTFERALELTTELEGKHALFRGAGLARLLQCRVNAMRGLDRTNEAGDYLDRFVSKHAKHSEVLSVAATLYAESGRNDRELELLVALSARVKPEAGLLTRRGLAEFRLGRNKQAAETLTRALDLSPEDVQARLLRAVVRFDGGQTDAARADYELLLKNPAAAQPALFGLGNMAWSAQDTNAAIRYYERFMSNNAAMTPQAGVVSERLRQMKDEQ
jgi:tetratricopeptide (TPR) repeat protein